MAAQRQIPGGQFVNEVGTAQRQIPGGAFVNETIGAGLVTLTVADAAHGHSVDNVALTQANLLAVQDAIHAHLADSISLIQGNVLIVSDTLHAHLVDILSLRLPTSLGSNSVPRRTISVQMAGRIISVTGASRTIKVH